MHATYRICHIYVYIYIYTYVIHMHATYRIWRICLSTYMYICICLSTYMYIYNIHLYVCTWGDTPGGRKNNWKTQLVRVKSTRCVCVCVCMYVCVCVCVCTAKILFVGWAIYRICHISTYVYTYIYTYICMRCDTPKFYIYMFKLYIYTALSYTLIYACIHIYIYIYIYIYMHEVQHTQILYTYRPII